MFSAVVEPDAPCSLKEPFAVRTPFTDDPGADVVLLSCDDLKFHVRTAILSLASPIFDDMLSFSRPVSPAEDQNSALDATSLPSVQLSESGEVIDMLLRYSYPVSPPRNITEFNTLVALLSASDKYQMDFLRVEVDIKIKASYAEDPRCTMLYFRRVFELRDEAQFRFYAWDCLNYSLVTLAKSRQVNSPEDLLPSLIEYHQSVSSRIAEFISDFNSKVYEDATKRESTEYQSKSKKKSTKSKAGRSSFAYGSTICSSCGWDAAGTYGSTWLKDNLVSIVSKVYKQGPISRNILPSQLECIGLCTSCREQASESWDLLGERLFQDIKDEARKVELSVPW